MKVQEKDLIGDIKGFPIEIVQAMCDEQVKQGNKFNVSVFQRKKNSHKLDWGFSWIEATNSGFWFDIIMLKNFKKFFLEKNIIPSDWCVQGGDKTIDIFSKLNKENSININSNYGLHVNRYYYIGSGNTVYKLDTPIGIIFTPEEVYQLFSNNKKMTEEKIKKRISSKEAQSIINIACNSWKEKLAVIWGTRIVLGNDIPVSEILYQEMREACTKRQHVLFDLIFGKDGLKYSDLKVGDTFTVKDGVYDYYKNRLYVKRSEEYSIIISDNNLFPSVVFSKNQDVIKTKVVSIEYEEIK